MRDAVVVLFGLFVQIPYISGDGVFVYPAIAIVMAIGFEVGPWDGLRSLAVIGIVLVICTVAALIRLISGKNVVTVEVVAPARVVITGVALFALALVPTVFIGAWLSVHSK